jgi:hypothetical protein
MLNRLVPFLISASLYLSPILMPLPHLSFQSFDSSFLAYHYQPIFTMFNPPFLRTYQSLHLAFNPFPLQRSSSCILQHRSLSFRLSLIASLHHASNRSSRRAWWDRP